MQIQLFAPFITYPRANSDEAGHNAVKVAKWLGARLHGTAINVDIPDVSNALSRVVLNTAELIKQAESDSQKRGTHILGVLKHAAAEWGVACETTSADENVATLVDAAAEQARYFDMSFVPWEQGNDMSHAAAEAVLFGSGRPMILFPELFGKDRFGNVAIAWDSSRAAARAVTDARPFLERAEKVHVITASNDKPQANRAGAERLAKVLRESGVDAEAVAVPAGDCPISETLQETAIEHDCELLVMGGYGHSRIRDFILGGATRGVLDSPLLPVLLSH
ncbi:MAG: universal stress protein [Rhizobiaceae bacterium]|nr:universal stress protein [Rhizobiaceae bacterium]